MIFRLLVSVLLLLLVMPEAEAGVAREWVNREGDKFTAELTGFDFEMKTAQFNGFDGKVFQLPVEELDFDGKVRLLVSKVYHGSFPEEHVPEKTRLVLVAVALPAAFHLVAFWLSGLLLAGKWNPIRAVVGWVGTILLGAFLATFYLYVASLSSESSLSFIIFGSIVATVALSLFVSVIFNTSTWQGGLIFVFHFVAAVALFFFATLIFEGSVSEVTKNKIGDEYVFRPVGLIR